MRVLRTHSFSVKYTSGDHTLCFSPSLPRSRCVSLSTSYKHTRTPSPLYTFKMPIPYLHINCHYFFLLPPFIWTVSLLHQYTLSLFLSLTPIHIVCLSITPIHIVFSLSYTNTHCHYFFLLHQYTLSISFYTNT